MEREGKFLDKEGRPANLLPAQVNQGILFLCPNQAPLFHRTRGQLHLLLLHRLNRQRHLPLRQEISSGLCYAPRFEVAPRLFYARLLLSLRDSPTLGLRRAPFSIRFAFCLDIVPVPERSGKPSSKASSISQPGRRTIRRPGTNRSARRKSISAPSCHEAGLWETITLTSRRQVQAGTRRR